MTCRYDTEAQAYLVDGEPCRTDDYGDPTHHCTARRTCAQHVGVGELTCARCLGRVRLDIRNVVEQATLMLPEALITGVNSQAAVLAGPATDVEAWSWHKVTAKQGRIWHVSLVEEDDDFHAFTVLTRWAWMISNAYNNPGPDVWTVSNAADYLIRVLNRIAQDPDQDFTGLAAEIRKCRRRHESVLHNSEDAERGAPCPTCTKDRHIVRLIRQYAHWCDDPDCTQQFHSTTDDFDVWVCPRNKDHWWNPQGYADLLKERTSA
jgi:hypothetical protein